MSKTVKQSLAIYKRFVITVASVLSVILIILWAGSCTKKSASSLSTTTTGTDTTGTAYYTSVIYPVLKSDCSCHNNQYYNSIFSNAKSWLRSISSSAANGESFSKMRTSPSASAITTLANWIKAGYKQP